MLLTQVSPLAANGYHAELLQDPGSPDRVAESSQWTGEDMPAPYVPSSEYKESNKYKQSEIQEMFNRVEAAYRALEEVDKGDTGDDASDFDSYAADARAACPECNFTNQELAEGYKELQMEADGTVAAEDLLHILANGLEGQRIIAGVSDPYTEIFPKFMMAGWVSEQTMQRFQSLFYYKRIKNKMGSCKEGRDCPLDDAFLYAVLFGDFGPMAKIFKEGFNNPYLAPSIIGKCGGWFLRAGNTAIYNGSKKTTGYQLFEETVTSIINSAKLQKYPPFEVKKLWEYVMIGSKLGDLIATWYNGGVFMTDFNMALYKPKQGQTDNHRNAWAELGQLLGYLATKDSEAGKIAYKLVNVVKNKGANYPFALGIVAQQGVNDKSLLKTITTQSMGDMTADDSMYILEGVYQAYRKLGGDPKKDLGIYSLQSSASSIVEVGDGTKKEMKDAVLAGQVYQALKDRETTADIIRGIGFAVDMAIIYMLGNGITAVISALLIMFFISMLAYNGVIDTESDWFNWTMNILVVVAVGAGIRHVGIKALRGKAPAEIRTILSDRNLGNVKEVLGSKTKMGAAVKQRLARGVAAERRAFYRMRKGSKAFGEKFKNNIAKLKKANESRRRDNGQQNNGGQRPQNVNGQRTNPVPDGNDPHQIVMDEPKPNTPGADYDFNAERIAKEARDAKVRETETALQKENWYNNLSSTQKQAVKNKLSDLENRKWYSDLPVEEKMAIADRMTKLENEGWYKNLSTEQQARVAKSMNELEGESWFNSLPEGEKTAIGEKMSQYSTAEQQKAVAYLEEIRRHDGLGRLGGSPEENAAWLKSVEDSISSGRWNSSDTSNLKGVVDRLNNIDSEVGGSGYGKLVFDGEYTPGKAPSATLMIEDAPRGALLGNINIRLATRGMRITNEGVLEGIQSKSDLQFALQVIEEQTGGKVRFTIHESGSLRYNPNSTTPQTTPSSYWAGKIIKLHVHYTVEVIENGRAVLRNHTVALDVSRFEVDGVKLGDLFQNMNKNYYDAIENAMSTIKQAQGNPRYAENRVISSVQNGLKKAKELQALLTKFRDEIYDAFSNGRTPDNMEGGLYEIEGMFENGLTPKIKTAMDAFRALRKNSPKPRDYNSWPEWLKDRYDNPTFIDLLKEDISILRKEHGYMKDKPGYIEEEKL